MRKKLLISVFVLGLTSIISQAIILRETISTFYGNEMFIGVILGSWLAWVGIGSGVLGKILNKFKKTLTVLTVLHLLIGFCFFVEIFLIRFVKTWFGFPGEIPNLIFAFISVIVIPAPLCLILGLWWTTVTKIVSKFYKRSEAWIVNKAYFLEMLGFIIGGILFSFILIHFQEFLIASILILLNLFTGLFLIYYEKNYFVFKIISIFLFLIFCFLIFSPYLANLNYITNSFRFQNQKLIQSVNSLYGNIAVTEINEQYNFYENGILLGSAEEIEFSENLIHISFLHHDSPEKVVLIGGGFNGALNEALKHPVQKIYYLELDPELIKISQNHISSELKDSLSDPKVEIINTDAFYFLKQTNVKFDLIIVNLPDPSTALINRFYTKEFFNTAKEKLNKDGIFVTHLTFSPTTPGKNLVNLNASLYKTLKGVFPYIISLPEDINLFLASQDKDLTQSPEALIQRFKQRQIKTKFLSENYITYRLLNDRVEKTLDLLEKNKQAKQNKSFTPVAYFYQILFWFDHFYISFSNAFKSFALHFWQIFVLILIFLTLGLIWKRKNMLKLSPILSVGIAGFSLMSLELIIIFTYQIIIGYLYFRIALLISAITAGMALGVWYGNRKIKTKKVYLHDLIKFHLFLIIFCAIAPLIFVFALKTPLMVLVEIVFLFICIIVGFLGTIIFPFSNKIYLHSQKHPNEKTGIIYGSDLIGSCFGALFLGLILIPVFGIIQSLIFISIINIWIIFILVLQKLGQ